MSANDLQRVQKYRSTIRHHVDTRGSNKFLGLHLIHVGRYCSALRIILCSAAKSDSPARLTSRCSDNEEVCLQLSLVRSLLKLPDHRRDCFFDGRRDPSKLHQTPFKHPAIPAAANRDVSFSKHQHLSSFRCNPLRLLKCRMSKHGLLVTTAKQSRLTNGSSYITSCRVTHQIQETNINTTVIDVLEKSSSDCPLTERSLRERIDKCLRRNTHTPAISSETVANLNKLQQITDDVKSLTKQLQLSVQLNRNNNSSGTTLDKRLLGEICYQLERRILLLIFSKSKQLYGYSLRYLPLIIDNEQNEHERSIYRRRLGQIEEILSAQKFHLNYHSILTFYFINQYGIYADYQWLTTSSSLLSDLGELKAFCYSLVSKEYHEDLSIIVNSLDLISHCDGKPLFYW